MTYTDKKLNKKFMIFAGLENMLERGYLRIQKADEPWTRVIDY